MSKPLDDGRFVELLTSTQVRLRAYALSLVRIPADADDLLQNACMALWRKREDFDPERDFFAWACGVVLTEVLRYRRKAATDKLMFDEVLINTLATEYLERSDELDNRREILHECVAKLSDKDRALLEDRYRSGVKPKEISERRGCAVTTVYSALSRIREALYRCVKSNLAQQSYPSHP